MKKFNLIGSIWEEEKPQQNSEISFASTHITLTTTTTNSTNIHINENIKSYYKNSVECYGGYERII